MPRHAGVPEEPVLAWWKSHEQDRAAVNKVMYEALSGQPHIIMIA